ncbi:MAG: hypothetical protein RIM84_07000 [Alphaproteobacteria bacterium]
MRYALAMMIGLLPGAALALDEFEAHDAYLRCFQEATARYLPDLCYDSDQLANFAHNECLAQAATVKTTAKVRSPAGALKNAQLSAKLAMYDMLRKYKANPGCNK